MFYTTYLSIRLFESNKKTFTMKLTHLAIIAIKGSRGSIVPKLAEALQVGEQTIYKYIRVQSDELTKAAALKVIREETGLTNELLLQETEAARA